VLDGIGKVLPGWFIRAHALSGDDPVKWHLELLCGRSKQVLVDVRNHGEFVPALQRPEGCHSVRKRLPVRQRHSQTGQFLWRWDKAQLDAKALQNLPEH
jgi:hypothetical protein